MNSGKTDLQRQLFGAYSTLGLLMALLNKMQSATISPLYIGVVYYQKLVTGLDSIQKLQAIKKTGSGETPQPVETLFIPQLIKIAAQHPDCSHIHEELLTLQEILFEFFKLAAFREDFDWNKLVKDKGIQPGPYGDDVAMLKKRLIDSINRLALITKQTFNLIAFPEFTTIALNMPSTDRSTWVTVGAPAQIVRFPKHSKKDNFIIREKTL